MFMDGFESAKVDGLSAEKVRMTARNRELVDRCDSLTGALLAVKSSVSRRIGRVLTTPFRFIYNSVRKRGNA